MLNKIIKKVIDLFKKMSLATRRSKKSFKKDSKNDSGTDQIEDLSGNVNEGNVYRERNSSEFVKNKLRQQLLSSYEGDDEIGIGFGFWVGWRIFAIIFTISYME